MLEYTLFQPGLIVDYQAPVGTSKHLDTPELFLDFNKRRAIILADKDPIFTFTTMADLAHVVARAVEYEGAWPVVGGVHGSTMSTSKLLEIGTKTQGMHVSTSTTSLFPG